MKQFVILFRQGPYDLTAIAKAHRQAAITLWAGSRMPADTGSSRGA
jgi:hypothetical protein